MIHRVSAWANQNRLVLGQQKVNEKSNEITAIPELLQGLDLNGAGKYLGSFLRDVFLTLLAWVYLYIRRIRFIISRKARAFYTWRTGAGFTNTDRNSLDRFICGFIQVT